MSNRVIHASETNYVILTPEQFQNDFGDQLASHDNPPTGPALVITNDENAVVAVIEGDNKAMLAELFGDVNDYAKGEADPGAVVAHVGKSQTVVTP